MRRTEQEFKAEVLRRSAEYRARQKKRLKKAALSVGCFVLLLLAVPFLPIGMGGSTEAADSAAEVVYSSQTNNKTEAVAEEGYQEAPAANAAETGSSNGAASRKYDIISIEVSSMPENEAYRRHFTDHEKIAAIMNAIEVFYTVDTPAEIMDAVGNAEGMSYVIIVHKEAGSHSYTLFDNGLYSDDAGCWIGVDESASRRLEEAISQASD